MEAHTKEYQVRWRTWYQKVNVLQLRAGRTESSSRAFERCTDLTFYHLQPHLHAPLTPDHTILNIP